MQLIHGYVEWKLTKQKFQLKQPGPQTFTLKHWPTQIYIVSKDLISATFHYPINAVS